MEVRPGVAQLAEQWTLNPLVVGSSPTTGSKFGRPRGSQLWADFAYSFYRYQPTVLILVLFLSHCVLRPVSTSSMQSAMAALLEGKTCP